MVRVRIIDTVALRPREDAKARLNELAPLAEDLRSRCLGAQEHIARLRSELLAVRDRLEHADTLIMNLPVSSLSGTRGKFGFLFHLNHDPNDETYHKEPLGQIPNEPGERFKALARYERILVDRADEIDHVLEQADEAVRKNQVQLRSVDIEMRGLSSLIMQERAGIELTRKEVVAAMAIGLGAAMDFVYETFSSADSAAMTGAKVFAGLLAGAVVLYYMLRDKVQQGTEQIERTRSIAEANLSMLDFRATAESMLKSLGDMRRKMEKAKEICLQGVEGLISAASSLAKSAGSPGQ